jgi:hypothetical protein
MAFKGRVLLNLKYHNRATLKYTLRQWYVNSVVACHNLFSQLVTNLVIYTNINKVSFFYRLQKTIKRTIIVKPKIKRIAIIIYLFTKNIFTIMKKTTF